MKLKKRELILISVGAFLFVLGLTGGWLLKGMSPLPAIRTVRNPQSQYPLINEILYTETPEAYSFPKFSPLKSAITSYTKSAEAKGDATEVAVYFRDLGAGNWVGINHTEQFYPASMLKVITLIALLHSAEAKPAILTDTIHVPASVTISTANDQDFMPPMNPVQSGGTYGVPELVQKLITQSDNGANEVLIEYMGTAAMATVFSNLNVPLPSTDSGVTAQQYSHLFRVLYNASYLSPSDSEQALELLSKTTFTQGLVAGVPSGTMVAHKFGEATLPGTPATHELHDCGIVYYPDHPYFLCVMTRGSDFTTLESVIKNVSQITWKEVSQVNG